MSVRTAHIGDPAAVLHCPFDGSGDVTSDSGGGVSCNFCGQSYVVYLQPKHPNLSQSPEWESELDQGFGGEPFGEPQDDAAAPFDEEPTDDGDYAGGRTVPGLSDDVDYEEAEPEHVPVDGQQTFRTASGHQLSREDYVSHLALSHTENPDDRKALAKAIKDSR